MANTNKKQHKATPVKPVTTQVPVKQKTIYSLLTRVIFLSFIVIGVLFFTDTKGYFNPDYTNDHTRRKWNAYYEFTKKHPVDVVLVGNSHLYTGINPENLSTALGANCFILASPGTTQTDAYFCLKEAIAVNKPKMAIVETFAINDYDSYLLKAGTLSDQFKSFSARKNIGQKLASTPLLFTSDNYLPAWSNTIRNHSFIFNDTEQIKKNIALNKHKQPEKPGLYLGRYARFNSGIEDTTLIKYDQPGFVAYDYNKHPASDEARKYLQKTIELCRENNVELVFLTLPMYYKHVHNYDSFKNDLTKELKSYHQHWLDLQQPYDTAAFTTECFENTVAENQHMTYYGSLVASYKLAHFVRANFAGKLPDRSNDIKWKQLFYASDGYFQNHAVEKDGVNKVLLKNALVKDNLEVKEIDFIKQQSGNLLLVKIGNHNGRTFLGGKLKIAVEAIVGGNTMIVPVEVTLTHAYMPINHLLFTSQPLQPGVDITAVKDISFF
jgi:hypothetical protein